MKILLIGLAVTMLAGCSSIVAKHTIARSVDGTLAYYVTSKYGGLSGTKDQSIKTLERYSKKICEYGYVKTGERDNIFVNEFGQTGIGVIRELNWEIKCNDPPIKS